MNLLKEKSEDFLENDQLYVISQIFYNKEYGKIYLKHVTELTVIKFTIRLAGTIIVFKYNKNDNSRVDLTDRLGRIESKIRPYRRIFHIEKMNISGFGDYNGQCFLQIRDLFFYYDMFRDPYHGIVPLEYKVTFGNDIISVREKSSKRHGYNDFLNMINCYIIHGLQQPKKNIKKYKKYIDYGQKYEIFIGDKYKNLRYDVIYNGIDKGVKDNGIDLIAIKNNVHTLIQCKNWKSNKYYKVDQKDIRAFIGDCCIYSINNHIDFQKLRLHFIIADENAITKNAINFIKTFKKIKYKVVEFKKDY